LNVSNFATIREVGRFPQSFEMPFADFDQDSFKTKSRCQMT